MAEAVEEVGNGPLNARPAAAELTWIAVIFGFAICSKPSLVASFSDGSFAGAMIAQMGLGWSFASAQAMAALQASLAIPCPCVSAANIQPISGSSPNSGSISRHAVKKPTLPTSFPSPFLSTAHVPKPLSCQPPTDAIIRRQQSSALIGSGRSADARRGG